MLTIYCGDNVKLSRKQYFEHKERLQSSQVECTHVSTSQLQDVPSMIDGSASLFSEKRALFFEDVCSKKEQREVLKMFESSSTVELVVWESRTDARNIKRSFPKAKVVVSNVPSTLWNLLDHAKPGYGKQLINELDIVSESVDEHMILFMLQSRIKDLILVKNGETGKRKLAPWQAKNLLSQANAWDNKALEAMYNKLIDIEVGLKTSSLPYSPHKALDILFMFYLK